MIKTKSLVAANSRSNLKKVIHPWMVERPNTRVFIPPISCCRIHLECTTDRNAQHPPEGVAVDVEEEAGDVVVAGGVVVDGRNLSVCIELIQSSIHRLLSDVVLQSSPN